MADRFDCGYFHLHLALLQDFLSGSVSPHFRGRRIHAQIFAGQGIALAVIETDLENARFPVQFDFDGARGPGLKSCHGCDRKRWLSETAALWKWDLARLRQT